MKIPELKHHKGTNNGYVYFKGKRYYFGKWGSPDCLASYHQWRQDFIKLGLEQLAVPQFQAPSTAPPAPTALAMVAARYAKHLYDAGRITTLNKFNYASKVLLELFGKTPANLFDVAKFEIWRQHLITNGSRQNYREQSPLRATYINQLTQSVVAMFRWAMVRDMFPYLSYEKIKAIEKITDDFQNVAPRKQIEIFDDTDFEKALTFCTKPVQAILRLMRLTGARPTEICTMKLSDLDVSDPECWIYHLTQHKTKKKTGKDKFIGLGKKAQKIIRAFIPLCQNEDDYLFKPTRKDNDRYDNHAIYTALRRACIKAGVRHINPYLARHTAITRANDETFSLQAGMDLVSHASTKTTRRYDHATIARIKKITMQLDRAS